MKFDRQLATQAIEEVLSNYGAHEAIEDGCASDVLDRLLEGLKVPLRKMRRAVRKKERERCLCAVEMWGDTYGPLFPGGQALTKVIAELRAGEVPKIPADEKARRDERLKVLAEFDAILEPYRKQTMKWNETGFNLMSALHAFRMRVLEANS